jgi:hypothetical protein
MVDHKLVRKAKGPFGLMFRKKQSLVGIDTHANADKVCGSKRLMGNLDAAC